MRTTVPRSTLYVSLAWLCACQSVPVTQAETDPFPEPDACAEPIGSNISIGAKSSLESAILNEERPYWVHVPESYCDKAYSPKQYPVLYVLDGSGHFPSVTGVTHHMSAGINGNIQIPELIVVAILNTTHRVRDMTPTKTALGQDGKPTDRYLTGGGGDEFFMFIKTELIPEVEHRYRTLPNRTIVGHSLGGLIALHGLLSEPELFQNYIAIDSSLTYDANFLVNQAAEILPQASDLAARVYMSMADHSEIAAPFVEANQRFAKLLDDAPSPNLQSKLRVFPGETHGSVPLLSLYYGLLFAFDGYKPSYEDLLGGHEQLAAHFVRVSKQMGVAYLPPDYFVDFIGKMLLGQAHDEAATEKAIGYLILNTTNYPNSPAAFNNLAQAYQSIGNDVLAMENFRKALALDADNQIAKVGLKTIVTH